MKTRFVRAVGIRASLRIYWGDSECPNCCGKGSPGYHNSHVQLMDDMDPNADNVGGEISDYPDDRWPMKCDHCEATVPVVADVLCTCGCGEMVRPDGAPRRQIFRKTLYGTPDGSWIGEPQPGDLFFADWYHSGGTQCHYWNNCTGQHLICILPNGDTWDTNSRASNCTMQEDKTHRCWVVKGDPSKGEPVHVSKEGPTCAAGAGSIVSGNYHGFLHHGQLTSC